MKFCIRRRSKAAAAMLLPSKQFLRFFFRDTPQIMDPGTMAYNANFSTSIFAI